MQEKILIVEDNADLASLVSMHMTDLGHVPTRCSNGNEALTTLRQGGYALAILDIMLPGMDGLDICKTLRAENNFVPIIMLTSRDSEVDRVVGLEMGADDYLTKPFSVRELQARVKAQLRRATTFTPENSTTHADTPANSNIEIGSLRIDMAKHGVSIDNSKIDLTAREFDLLCYLAQRPGQVFTRTQLLDAVWGYAHEGYEHTVNSHINRLRSKIEADPSKPAFIETVWGVGYKFSESLSA